MLDPKELPLRDIHLPSPVGWWPLAPGWWVLLAAALLLVLGSLGISWYLQRTRIRRAARAELTQIKIRYAAEGDQTETIRTISMWCRRVALAQGSSPDAVGEAWLSELDRLAGGQFFSAGAGRCLREAPYRAAPSFDAQELFSGLAHWIEKLPPPANRVRRV